MAPVVLYSNTECPTGKSELYQENDDSNIKLMTMMKWMMVRNDDHWYIDGLVQERRNSSALAMELCLSCINSSIWWMMVSDDNDDDDNMMMIDD